MSEEAYTLDGVHDDIYLYYQSMHHQIKELYLSRGLTADESYRVRTQEQGRLADLWSLADRLTYEEENNNG